MAVVAVTQLLTLLKTHQFVQLKSAYFTVGKLYLNAGEFLNGSQ